MFDSGIMASALIGQIKDETDIALPIPAGTYISWLNALEQLLYTEFIREQGKIELDGVDSSVIDIGNIDVPDGENAIRFEDIHAIYVGETQLIKSTVASSAIFLDSYYKIGNGVGLNIKDGTEKIKIIYFVKPELKTENNITSRHVMVPVEFIDLVKAKLRGEAYKLANEGAIAANWLNDYNILLENFKLWLSERQPNFGM